MLQPKFGALGFGNHSTREDFSNRFGIDTEVPAIRLPASPKETTTVENTPSTIDSTLDPLT
jgi:hypothetical protein